MYHLAYEAV